MALSVQYLSLLLFEPQNYRILVRHSELYGVADHRPVDSAVKVRGLLVAWRKFDAGGLVFGRVVEYDQQAVLLSLHQSRSHFVTRDRRLHNLGDDGPK